MRLDKRVVVNTTKSILNIDNSIEIYDKEEVDELITNATNSINNTNSTINVVDGLIANGTDETTTAVLEYGVNVFSTVTATNYCAKLPQPVTGKSTRIVNMSNAPLVLYPSNIGGQINNLAIDTPVMIPPDGVSYEFICIENPLPGAWTWTPPATGQIEILEIEVNHTNGVSSGGQGMTTATLNGGTLSAGVDGNGNILLTGDWATETNQKILTVFKCYTNILRTDLVPGYSGSCVTFVKQTHKNNVNSITQGERATSFFRGDIGWDTAQEAPVGTLNNPLEVGDTGTLYDIQFVPPNGEFNNLGPGGVFSRAYYSLGIQIPATAATKIYKFKIFLEYV